MELSSPIQAAAAHTFIHPTFKTKQRHTRNHQPSILNIETPSAPHPPLKTSLLRRPEYKNTAISTPQKDNKICKNTNKNTILDVLRLMDALGLQNTPDIYASLVDECTKKQDAVEATELYAHMKRNSGMVGFLNRSSGLFFLNRVLMLLVVSGCLDVAHQLFDEMPHRNYVSLSIVIAGFVNSQLFDRALGLFVEMHPSFIYEKNDVAVPVVGVCVLKACVRLKRVYLGKMVHGWLLKMGYDRELNVGTALVEFYGKCRCLSEVNEMFFDHVKMAGHCETVLWSGAVVNRCRGECLREVFRIFREMGRAGARMNEYTFSSVLKACGRLSDDDGSYGRQVHANAVKLGLDTHVSVISGLVDTYGKCGLLKDARKVFETVDQDKRNSACWNSMITGFVRHGFYIEAIKMLYQMKAAGFQPEKSMIDAVRVACGSVKLRISDGSDSLYDDNLNECRTDQCKSNSFREKKYKL